MRLQAETDGISWMNRLIAVGTLCLAAAIMVGCHDHDTDVLYHHPDLVDDDADNHYVSALTVVPGEDFIIGIDVRSRYSWSDDFVTRYYLSYNDTITDNDLLLGTYYSTGLDSGERERQWIAVTFPDVIPGRYYIGCIIDEGDRVDEYRESNNVVVFRERIDVLAPLTAPKATEEATETVEVPDMNFAPIATCAESDVFGKIGNPITLSASGSSDPEGDDLTYSWIVSSLPDGADATAFANVSGDNSITQFTPSKTGNYVFLLTVSDGKNESTDSVTIIVE